MTVNQDSVTATMDYDSPGAGPGRAQGAGRPGWGPWATVGLSIVVLVVYVLLQVVAALFLFFVNMARDPAFDAQAYLAGLQNDGFLLAVATTVSALLTTGLIVLLVRLRKGPSVRDYLCLAPVGLRSALVWLAATLVLVAASDSLTLLLDRPVVPEVMVEIYRSAGVLPLFWLAVVVMAPLFEEVFFRGFLFAGLERSRLGGIGAIVVTALAWAAIHLQYDLYGIATIFALGLLLGAARLKARSLPLTIGLHAAINLIASLELVLLY